MTDESMLLLIRIDFVGYSSLHYVTLCETQSAIRLLIAAGARMDLRNKFRATPLSISVFLSLVAVCEFLLASGADPNKRYGHAGTALVPAVQRPRGRVPIVEALLKHGADPNLPGTTCLSYAASRGHDDVVKILLPRVRDLELKSETGHRHYMVQLMEVPAPAST
ncbi:ankyrin repeat-containing domain protein [Aspergillus crustosus]